MTPPGGEPIRRAGDTLSILRKQPEGKWVLARDANLVMKAS
jgi:ketosteroid isomerase-like protein